MIIDLWYDAVYTETRVCIDGYWQDTSDIYGFLYPVLHYPLQTWLYGNGSWSGLYKQLMELSRGEEIVLVFHGRKTDYEDLKKVIPDENDIVLKFDEWDMETVYGERLLKTENILKELDFFPEKNVEFQAPSFSDVAVEEWCKEIFHEEELSAAIKNPLPCICIHDSFIPSFDKLSDVEKLCQSLKRPADAIFFVIADEKKKDALARYASLFPSMGFHFCTALDCAEVEKVFLKYGKPYILKKNLFEIHDTAEQLQLVLEQYDSIKKEIQDIIQDDQHGKEIDTEKLSKLRKKKLWIESNRTTIHGLCEMNLRHEINLLERGAGSVG